MGEAWSKLGMPSHTVCLHSLCPSPAAAAVHVLRFPATFMLCFCCHASDSLAPQPVPPCFYRSHAAHL